jgi:hypothetical protein
MLMHFLGGVWLSLLSIYFFSINRGSFKSVLKILLIVLLIGIGWEVFEILIDKLITLDSFNFLDTLSDICFDFSGGAFGILYFLKRIMSIEENKI